MRNRIKLVLKYLFFFTYFFLCIQFIFTEYSLDTYNNYAFSYALTMGQIPYVDFNLVVPLFSPFLYSIGLFINHSILVFYIEQAILLTTVFLMIEKMIGKKAYLFILIMLVPYPIQFIKTIFPGYNFILFFFYILLIYLEQRKVNDKLIGIVLGCALLTKQTVGFFYILVNILYYLNKDKKKLATRLLYLFIPIVIQLIYLIFTSSLTQFINLCFLGLFDFSKKNTFLEINCLIIIIILLLCNLYLIIEKKWYNDISYLYYLAYSTIFYPLIDNYHVALSLLGFIFIFFYKSSFQITKKNVEYSFLVISMTISILFFNSSLKCFDLTVYSFKNNPLKLYDKKEVEYYKQINKEIAKYDKKVICLFQGQKNILFHTNRNEKITYYSTLNHGNYGYNGDYKVYRKFIQEKNSIVLVDTSINIKSKGNQYIYSLAKYTRKKCKLLKKIGEYEIYYKS